MGPQRGCASRACSVAITNSSAVASAPPSTPALLVESRVALLVEPLDPLVAGLPTPARSADINDKGTAVNYAGRGTSYESEGVVRDVNVAFATSSERHVHDPINPGRT